MNNLCICQHGHSRSVALARLFHERGDFAVAIGWQYSGKALPALCEWADRIFLMETSFIKFIPGEYQAKCIDFNVGPDIWSNPYNQDLLALLRRMMKEQGI